MFKVNQKQRNHLTQDRLKFRDRHRFGAYVSVDGKNKSLGRFDTAEEAHEAYRVAAVERFGEFARFE
jgi:hypothetical protein